SHRPSATRAGRDRRLPAAGPPSADTEVLACGYLTIGTVRHVYRLPCSASGSGRGNQAIYFDDGDIAAIA
ncbi:hypothetical protein ACFQZ8_08330, partial [Micromonospora azadirachtae]